MRGGRRAGVGGEGEARQQERRRDGGRQRRIDVVS